MVPGNFCNSCSLVVTISVNPRKTKHCYYAITKSTINSEYFMDYIKVMAYSGFFLLQEVFMLDNAAVHHGAKACELEEFL